MLLHHSAWSSHYDLYSLIIQDLWKGIKENNRVLSWDFNKLTQVLHEKKLRSHPWGKLFGEVIAVLRFCKKVHQLMSWLRPFLHPCKSHEKVHQLELVTAFPISLAFTCLTDDILVILFHGIVTFIIHEFRIISIRFA